MSFPHLTKAMVIRAMAFATLTLPALQSAANSFNPEAAQDPLFLTAPVRPLMMLNMSNDHQLFFKLYDDYSDLDGDGTVDTTYQSDYMYYGYFSSGTCYKHSNSRFSPAALADDDYYCEAGNSHWSGNFLNWATMTRMDAVRKILYGGKRSVDTADAWNKKGVTVLERAFLPNDAHSFAKYYNGSDVDRLTPFSGISVGDHSGAGITICNTTHHTGRKHSQDVNDPPLMRVAKGNFSLWASNERWQCLWQEDIGDKSEVSFRDGGGKSGNDTAASGIPAHDESPEKSKRAGEGDYAVEVSVCVEGYREENCFRYPTGDYKPRGLLQEYGEDGVIHFGLLTGSYKKNKSGGVLRKNVGDLTDEVSVDSEHGDGTFNEQPADGGIISTLDRFRLYGYNFSTGLYSGDSCGYGLHEFDDGSCSNWGNPQSEIYLEALRYFADAGASGAFSANDSNYISGLHTASWKSPLDNENYCAPLNVIQFNASTSSYDGDQLGGASDLATGSDGFGVSAATDAVGVSEGVDSKSYFFGEVDGGADADVNQLCTAKTVSGLSNVLGTCPDAPRLQGSYQIAGLAHIARSEGIPLGDRVTNADAQNVKTYGVALAPAVPKIDIPVPGSRDQVVSIQPACRNTSTGDDSNCAIVDFKVVDQDHSGTSYTGTLYINWEDSEQGGDYDQDMWGVLDYEMSEDEVTIGTQVIAQSTPNKLGFGYVVGGTERDGFHVHSGINYFTHTSPAYTDTENCGDIQCTCVDLKPDDRGYEQNTECTSASAERTEQTLDIGSSGGELLELPLYYAAKWGGYNDDDWSDEDIAEWDPEGDSYFFAQEPQELAQSLRKAFARIAASDGSASAVATNSTRLEQDTHVYQARFNSENWSGELRAFKVLAGGRISSASAFSTDDGMTTINPDTRNILTVNSETGERINFKWLELSDEQRDWFEIEGSPEAVTAPDRFNWVRGRRDKERSGDLRERDKLLGDIVNSSPVYFGDRNEGHAFYRPDYREYLADKADEDPLILVGANDGMLHAFYADDSSGKAMQERFAYVPKGAYPHLARLSEPNYGSIDNPHQYTVDGGLAISDVYVDGQWRTVVAGTLGAGGKGIYALDITEPSSPEVIFDYTGENDDDLGYITGSPVIARMANGKWMVVFGNGYASGGDSYLFGIDLDSPSLSDVKIAAGGASTGLSPVSLLTDRSGAAVRGYAGDLGGNMWRFNLGAESSSDWALGLDSKPLFTAKDANGNLQPITAPPELGFNLPKGNAVMVYFGTGKYLDKADNDIDYGNSVYAIADTGAALTYSSDERTTILHEKELSGGQMGRSVGANFGVNWSTVDGWFMDFDEALGERLIQKPSLLFDRLLFATVSPSDVPCDYGGTSWLMEVAAVGDRFNEDMLLGDPVRNDSMILGQVMVGILSTSEGLALWNTSDGAGFTDDRDNGEGGSEYCDNCAELEWPANALGRQSWQQIR